MSAKLMEMLNFFNVANSSFIAANEDIFNGDPATDVISMAKYDNVVFFILKSAGATGTATVTVESCDDVTPSTATAIAFTYRVCTSGNTWGAATAATSAGFATTAGADQMYLIEVASSELYSTDSFVRMQLTEVVDSPCDGAVGCVAGRGRYGDEVLTS